MLRVGSPHIAGHARQASTANDRSSPPARREPNVNKPCLLRRGIAPAALFSASNGPTQMRRPAGAHTLLTRHAHRCSNAQGQPSTPYAQCCRNALLCEHSQHMPPTPLQQRAARRTTSQHPTRTLLSCTNSSPAVYTQYINCHAQLAMPTPATDLAGQADRLRSPFV